MLGPLLADCGFTATEAKVYQALLRSSHATGYALARSAGLARANVYEALEALATRGAALRVGGRPARYQALEPLQLLDMLEQESATRLGMLRAEFAALEDKLRAAREHGRAAEPGAPSEDIVRRSVLIARAVACAASATRELLAVVGPWAHQVYGALEAAQRRRIPCRILSLGKPAPAHAAVRDVAVAQLGGYWGGLPLILVADRSRAVCGVLGSGGDASGVATGHPGVVPFLRHLLRRELASAGGTSLS